MEIASAKLQEEEGGMQFFWRSIVDRKQPILWHFQDSSVILVDKSKHPKLLQVRTCNVIDMLTSLLLTAVHTNVYIFLMIYITKQVCVFI